MRRARKGYIFIEALIVVAGLAALMVMLAADERASSDQVQNRLRQRRAEMAANAAVAQAMATLQQANPNVVLANDTWAQAGRNGGNPGSEEFDQGDGSTYRMQIVDASSMLNLNTATQEQLQTLPLVQAQVDSLLDWRETSTQPRADGAKDQFYNALSQPYNTKLGPLTTVDELLLIDNWTAQTLYQPPTTTTPNGWPTDPNNNLLPLAGFLTVDSGSPNTQADGSARVNLSQRPVNVGALQRLGIDSQLADRIAAGAPYTNFSGLLAVRGLTPAAELQLMNAVTFTTSTRLEGKINLNTATQAVLETVPTVTQDLASAIVSQQSSGFNTFSQLANVQGITPPELEQIADSFTIGSDTWVVRAYGQDGGIGVAVEAVVGQRNGQMQVVNWQRLNTTTVPTWWNWDTQSSTTVTAGNNQ